MERLVIISNKYLDFLAVRVGYYLFSSFSFFFFLFLIFCNLIWLVMVDAQGMLDEVFYVV